MFGYIGYRWWFDSCDRFRVGWLVSLGPLAMFVINVALINNVTLAWWTFAGCNITFREISNAHGDGATPNSNYTTQQSCLDYCALLSSCVAVDVDNTNLPSIGCWVYTNASYILPDNSLYDGGGMVNEYQITRNCAPTTVTGKTTCK